MYVCVCVRAYVCVCLTLAFSPVLRFVLRRADPNPKSPTHPDTHARRHTNARTCKHSHTTTECTQSLFKQVRTVLIDDGMFLGAMFGEQTLYELRGALQHTHTTTYTHPHGPPHPFTNNARTRARKTPNADTRTQALAHTQCAQSLFKQVRSVRKDDGMFLGAMFGEQTLYELRGALQHTNTHVHPPTHPHTHTPTHTYTTHTHARTRARKTPDADTHSQTLACTPMRTEPVQASAVCAER